MRMWIAVGCIAGAASAAVANDSLLLEVTENPGTGFGDVVESVPDLNDDGVPEFAVGKDSPQEISIRDGATGAQLFAITPFQTGSGFGSQIKLVGDLDGDGVRDLYIGQWGGGRVGSPPGFGTVVSLMSKEALIVCHGVASTGFFGSSVADMGDVTGDGVPDLVIGEPGVGGVAGGNVAIYSGSDGSRLEDRAMYGEGVANLGRSVCCMGDIDGDGVNDYAAGAPQANPFEASFGTSYRGEVRVRSGAPNGLEFAIPGGARRFRNSSGEKVVVGEFFGFSVAGGDVDGDGRPDLVAAGRVNGGIVKALTAVRRPKLIGQVTNPNPASNIGDGLLLMPSSDGLPGREVITTGSNGVLVFSFGGKQPALVAELRGEEGEFAGFTFAVLGDLGTSSTNPLPDGTPDVLMASSVTGRVFALAMPTQQAQLPKSVKQGAVFGKSAATIDTKASGRLKTVVKKGTATFGFSFKNLPAAATYGLFLETAPGSGMFDSVGSFDGASGKIELDGSGALPAAFGGGQFGSLGGRVVELRDATGAVAMTSVLPLAAAPKKAKVSVPFAVADGSPFPTAVAASKLSTNAATGKTAFTLKLKNVDTGQALELWGETTSGSGEFAKIGDLNRGKIKLDAKGGIFFPNFPRVDIATLIRRLLQVRTGAGAIVLSTASPPTPRPDLVVSRVKLRFTAQSFDAFTIRANVLNQGSADAGPVNLVANVVFQLGDVTRTRTIATRTNDGFAPGEEQTNLVIDNIDNPFAGQRPTASVTIIVDPDSTGGSGEYAEEDETNNSATSSFSVDVADNDDYDRD